MPKKRGEETTWISAPETIKVLERVNDRKINPKYLSVLVNQKRLARKKFDGRTFLYSKEDAEQIHIIERKGAGRKKKAEQTTSKEDAA